jgi:hypothetical protein
MMQNKVFLDDNPIDLNLENVPRSDGKIVLPFLIRIKKIKHQLSNFRALESTVAVQV